MDPRNQGQRPAARPAVRETPAATPVSTPSPSGGNRKAKMHNKKVSALLIVAVLLVASLVGWHKFGPTPGVQSDKYQAVFLDNDQVYFGKIKDIDHDTVILTDIYYLQKQSGEQSVSQAASDATSQGNLSLVKLGAELHAPQDEMRINRDQVVFWENLKSDGKVAEAIKNYKK